MYVYTYKKNAPDSVLEHGWVSVIQVYYTRYDFFQESRQCLSQQHSPRLLVNDYSETSRVLTRGSQSQGNWRTIRPSAQLKVQYTYYFITRPDNIHYTANGDAHSSIVNQVPGVKNLRVGSVWPLCSRWGEKWWAHLSRTAACITLH